MNFETFNYFRPYVELLFSYMCVYLNSKTLTVSIEYIIVNRKGNGSYYKHNSYRDYYDRAVSP